MRRPWLHGEGHRGEFHFTLGGTRGKGTGGTTVKVFFADGKKTTASVEGFEGTRTYSGSVDEADIRIEQDRLTGTLAYTLTDPASPAGKYRFAVTGIVEGDGVHGYWLGTRDGKDILVKSSRLNARLIRAGQTDAPARE